MDAVELQPWSSESILEEYLPTFPNFIVQSLRKDASNLWKLYISGLLKKPSAFDISSDQFFFPFWKAFAK